MRKSTDPGAPAPPATGSVGPLVLDPIWPEDEVPTKPDNSIQPELMQLVRIVDSMPVVERRRFVAFAEHYRKCGLGRRVILEEVAREFAGKGEI